MKVTATTAKTSPDAYVQLDHLVKHKEMIYRDIDPSHVSSLVEDIGANGLLNPICTFSVGADQKVKLNGEAVPAHFIAAGLHRRDALVKLRASKPEAFKKLFANGVPVRHFVVKDVTEALFIMLRENVQRREMTPEEIFPVLEKLAEEPFNLTGKQIAAKIGKSTSWVSQHMAVNEELPEDVKKEVHSGKIATGDARKLAGEVRKSRKNGEDVSDSEIREKASKLKDKKAAKEASGGERASGDERRVSARKILGRLKAMPKIAQGREILVLRGAIEYLAGETDKLPAEIRKEVKPSKVEKTPEKKAKK